MSDTAVWVTVLVCLGLTAGVLLLVLRSEREYARKADRDATQAAVTVGWNHSAPDYPLSVRKAHQVMQQHRECFRDECPRKRAAWQVLVEAQRMKPDPGREL